MYCREFQIIGVLTFRHNSSFTGDRICTDILTHGNHEKFSVTLKGNKNELISLYKFVFKKRTFFEHLLDLYFIKLYLLMTTGRLHDLKRFSFSK